MSDVTSINNELSRIDAAMSEVSAAMERLKLTRPARDEERDQKRDELRAARVRFAVLRTQAASDEVDASELRGALETVDELEIALASEEEQEERFYFLNDLHSALFHQREETYARLGKATYTSLKTDLALLAERVEQAEARAAEARQAVSNARASMPSKLTSWPALASDARATYASERQPSHAERVIAAQIALWDAMEHARGKVGTVVNDVNVMQFFEMTSERADAVLHRSIGRVVDERVKHQAQGVLAALRSMRNAS
jgi:chromosome segregation ATPase